MGIIYKKLTYAELDVFIQMRIEQLREEVAEEDIDLAGSDGLLQNTYGGRDFCLMAGV